MIKRGVLSLVISIFGVVSAGLWMWGRGRVSLVSQEDAILLLIGLALSFIFLMIISRKKV